MQTISYELKYCERCGSLRLRRADSAEDYCPSCERALWQSLSPDALVSKLRRKPRAQKKGRPGLQRRSARASRIQQLRKPFSPTQLQSEGLEPLPGRQL
jgi:hypothetical protein